MDPQKKIEILTACWLYSKYNRTMAQVTVNVEIELKDLFAQLDQLKSTRPNITPTVIPKGPTIKKSENAKSKHESEVKKLAKEQDELGESRKKFEEAKSKHEAEVKKLARERDELEQQRIKLEEKKKVVDKLRNEMDEKDKQVSEQLEKIETIKDSIVDKLEKIKDIKNDIQTLAQSI